LKHRRLRGEWQHRERMRALELGLPIPQSNGWPALVAMVLGGGVPAAAFFFSWLRLATSRLRDDVFIAAALAGTTGVVCGYKLAGRLLAAQEATSELHVARNGKPFVSDPDAYDVVSRRG